MASVVAIPAAAQPAWFSPEALAAHFAEGVANPALMRDELERIYGAVPDAIWQVMERHMVSVTADPGYAPYVYVNGAPLVTMAMTIEDLATVTTRVDLLATTNGILRLSQKRQEALLRVSGDVFRWMGENRPDSCPEAMLGDDIMAAGREELAFVAAQSPAYVDAYYSVVYAALAAEIAGAPEMRRVEQELDALAPFDAYQAAVIDIVAASPNAEEIIRAITTGTTGTPAVLCEFGAITIDAIFTLTPAERQTVVLGILGEAAGVSMIPD
ncbi:MAG: hypothetical protein KIT43_04565 [Bauldia sp.]|nr:hypothetical protein [Bauldia sp.]MCW5717955.1 hypothetical protein [Bauldia sp.]